MTRGSRRSSCASRSSGRAGMASARAVLELVQKVDFPRLVVEPADADVVGLQHLAQLVADEVDDALEVERSGHALLDAVDHRELGVALLGLLQQALRLVEQARVLQRDAHRRSDRFEQAQFGLAERMLALVVLELQAAERRGRWRRSAR